MGKIVEKVVYHQLDPKDVARWAEQRRGRDNVARCPEGFTFSPSGRDGFIYYRSGLRTLELYWEMSGVPQYDILLSLEGLKEWVAPDSEPTSPGEQTEIRVALERWLASRGMKASMS